VIADWLNRTVYWIEVLVAVALVILTALALVGLVVETGTVLADKLALTPEDFSPVIVAVLDIFILIELFRIALAYMKHQNVIPTVLEAALVAVARKFVVYEAEGDLVFRALGLSALLISVGVAWWLLAKSDACELPEEHHSSE
jgi:uncharacterized membrane protein (DUF373 family)